jgi:hypothetical protein
VVLAFAKLFELAAKASELSLAPLMAMYSILSIQTFLYSRNGAATIAASAAITTLLEIKH